jgi:2-keto-4-pentenoate hydratase/2-oxohepta-3-ene-1,7-dioic acid hydratase in catechol pathway
VSRWVRFRADGRECFGTLQGGEAVEHAGEMFGENRSIGRTHAAGSFALLTPVVPGKIVALWNNFHALANKLGKPVPTYPPFFIKSSSSVIGSEEPIRRPAGYTGKIVFEGELGIVIGKTCRNVGVSEAPRFIFGYTCVNDVTAMDVLFENPDFPQWSRSKSFDSFGCLGPTIATDIDPTTLNLVTRVDGAERQNYPLFDMVFKPHELVSRISHDLTFLPGDVIACGTSIGVGSIKDGATVEVSIDGIGVLRNKLAAGA